MSQPVDQTARWKREAAEYAVSLVQPGMLIGLGTGSTALFATRRLAQLLREGKLKDATGLATSNAVRAEAQNLGIPLIDEGMPHAIDLTIDGADEVDPQMDLIKGRGGALLREKIVAQASNRLVFVVDESKTSPRLGTRCAVPVEVLSFGWQSQARFLESLGARVAVRSNPDGSRWFTDSGNLILDCVFGPIANAAALAAKLGARAGVVEHGLFLGLATDLIVAGKEGIQHLRRGAS